MISDLFLNSFSVTQVLFLLGIGLTAYLILAWIFAKTPENLPPGPKGWTKTFQLLKAQMNYEMHELAAKWAKEYGPITFFYNFGQPIAFLNSAEIGRKLFGSEEYKLILADRVPSFAPRLIWFGKDLIFTKYDAFMRKKRRLFHKVIGLYGDGVHKFEVVVNQEMDRFIQELDNSRGNDLEFSKSLGTSLKCIMYILVLGERPPDVSTPDILEDFDMVFNKLWSPDIDFILNYIPVLSKIPGRYKRAVDSLLLKTAKAEFLMYDQAKNNHVPGNPKGIADLLFDQSTQPGYEWLAEDPQHIKSFLTSLFLAGHLTTKAAVLGIFLCLLNHPRVARKIQVEIDTVIGSRRPKIEDRSDMPYTEACVLESIRLISQAPIAGWRTSNADIHVDAMFIPKGTLFVLNNWFSFHDEKIWEDPWNFKPERFLDTDGSIFPADHPVRKDAILFGFGLRSCSGEVFARSRVFLFLTNVLQKFDLLPPANEKLVPAEFRNNDGQESDFIRQVQSYKCRLLERKKHVTINAQETRQH